MSAIPNPRNGYVPIPGELVRVVGACHPSMLGRIVQVTRVYDGWADIKYEHPEHGTLYTSGELGGLEPLAKSQEEPREASKL